MARKLYEIAAEVRHHWPKVNYAAEPYLAAMACLETLEDRYGADSARSIVSYFLANASHFRGEEARRLKRELNEMLNGSRR